MIKSFTHCSGIGVGGGGPGDDLEGPAGRIPGMDIKPCFDLFVYEK